MLNTIIMTLDCLVSNPLRKQIFHQDYIVLRSLIIIYIIERFAVLKGVIHDTDSSRCIFMGDAFTVSNIWTLDSSLFHQNLAMINEFHD